MILAGDIGGTKTNLALFDWKTDRVEPEREQTFFSADFESFEEVLAEFLKPPAEPVPSPPAEGGPAEPVPPQEKPPGPPVQAACFGVAGPVIRGAPVRGSAVIFTATLEAAESTSPVSERGGNAMPQGVLKNSPLGFSCSTGSFRLIAAGTSVSVSVSNTETNACVFATKLTGRWGEAPTLTT